MAGLNKKKEFCVWAHFDEESSLALNHIKERANANLSGPKFEAHLTLVGSLESVDSSIYSDSFFYNKTYDCSFYFQ